MSRENHIVDIFLFYPAWPDDDLLTSVNTLPNSIDNFSIAGLVIINKNRVASFKITQVTITTTQSHAIVDESAVKGSFDHIDW